MWEQVRFLAYFNKKSIYLEITQNYFVFYVHKELVSLVGTLVLGECSGRAMAKIDWFLSQNRKRNASISRYA